MVRTKILTTAKAARGTKNQGAKIARWCAEGLVGEHLIDGTGGRRFDEEDVAVLLILKWCLMAGASIRRASAMGGSYRQWNESNDHLRRDHLVLFDSPFGEEDVGAGHCIWVKSLADDAPKELKAEFTEEHDLAIKIPAIEIRKLAIDIVAKA
jgi:DNA-binding transcriptional MerR regulator